VGVSLFPFLAVLVCTMGALILVLVVVVQQAQVQAATAVGEAVAEQQSELKTEREMAQWRISQMRTFAVREKTEVQLAEARLKLGHVEDHSRQLRDELAGLAAAWDELQKLGTKGNRDRDKLAAKLAELEARVAESQRRLEEARADARQKSRSHAIVPYQGAHGTRRRPIYIECRRDAVILQPEGIVFNEADFDGPLGAGNPLAVALRTVREHMLERQDFDPTDTSGGVASGSVEPYPLLLIRPGGIAAYYAARSAMKSWGSEFGYELVDADWELEFQPADRRLAELIGREVEVARLRQRRLAAAAPRQYGGRPRQQYTVSAGRGGVVPYGNPQVGHDNRGGWGGAFAGSGGAVRGKMGNGSHGGTGNGARHGTSPEDSHKDYPYGRSADAQGGYARQQQAGSSYGPGDDGGGVNQRGPHIGSPTGAATPQGTGALASGQTGTDGVAGESGPSTGSQTSGSQAAGSAGATGGGAGGGSQRPGGSGASVGSPTHGARSLAASRGRDWGLPGATRGSVPITRPIGLNCYADRLEIVSKRNLPGKTIGLARRTEQSIDDLVSAVWEQIESWGIAGRGMYWRPVLKVSVAPDAEHRYVDLSTLLDGSGLTVVRVRQ